MAYNPQPFRQLPKTGTRVLNAALVAIADAGAIPPLVALLRNGSADRQEQAAAALGLLAGNNAVTAATVEADSIAPLVELVRNGRAVGQERAARALANIARGSRANQAAIVEAGVVGPLVALVRAGGSLGAKAAAEALAKLDLAVISSRVEPPQAKEASRSKRRLEAPECVVCFERARAVAFVPCGHFCVCSKCGQRLSECPICRKSTRKQRIYT